MTGIGSLAIHYYHYTGTAGGTLPLITQTPTLNPRPPPYRQLGGPGSATRGAAGPGATKSPLKAVASWSYLEVHG